MTIKIETPDSVGMSEARLSRIESVMAEQIKQGALVGANTLVARKGKLIHCQQHGYQDREAQCPMQVDTIFRLYSMTKPIICTAFMTLYEQGKFDLKDPVSKYIPAFAKLKVLEKNTSGVEQLVELTQPVSIHHLLTHTSGLVYDFYESYSVCQQYRDAQLLYQNRGVSLEEFVDRLCTMPLAFQPGSHWYYSVSIDVVARLIEIIADQPLAEFLAETLFKPLNMVDTTFCLSSEQQSRLAAMYGKLDLLQKDVSWTDLINAWENNPYQRLDINETTPIDDPNFARGGHGLHSTMQDFYHFSQLLLNRGEFSDQRLLSPKTIDFMHMNHISLDLLPIGFEDWKLFGYGFGLGSRVLLNVAEVENLSSVGEYGWSGAAKTYYWVDPQEDLIGIFLAQSMCDFSMIDRIFQTLVYQSVAESFTN